MNLDDLKNLREQIAGDASNVTDEQLTDARTAIQAEVAKADQMPKESVADRQARNAVLRQLVEVKAGVDGEVATREAAASDMDAEAADLMAGLAEPEKADTPDGDEPSGEAPAADNTDAVEQPAEPELIAASGAGLAAAIVAGVDAAFTAREKAAAKPVGRKAERITPAGHTPAAGNPDAVKAVVYGGQDAAGAPIESTFALSKALHDKFRTIYQDSSFSGRVPIAHVAKNYPDSHKLGTSEAENFAKMEALNSPKAIVAAGGLCAPLETLYDVEVLGSAARPIKDALTGYQVERGGITYRPNTSAATAVHGAGVWTLDDDAATDGRVKACYEVECPGLQQEYIEAIYSCLEFSNITTRFDPETTATNITQAEIAHARIAENRLLSKMSAQSKILSAPQVIGATRDLLANVDKTVAYYRNRHRIDTALPLTWLAPAWVMSLMRADLARQMAAGDWAQALAPADADINSWFARRGITPVWHMDGVGGVDEVQTITVTGTPTGGTFTLALNGKNTSAIPYNATAAQVKSALGSLPDVDASDVTTAGGPLPGTPVTVTFSGGVGDGHDVPQMTANSTGLTGGTTPAVTVATTTGGGTATTVNGITIASQTYGDAPAGGVIPGFPDQIDSLLFAPGAWLFLDGGTLDLGLVRDSTLNSKNRYRQFMETFEGAAFRGIESLRLIMSVQPTGQTSGTKSLDAIAD